MEWYSVESSRKLTLSHPSSELNRKAISFDAECHSRSVRATTVERSIIVSMSCIGHDDVLRPQRHVRNKHTHTHTLTRHEPVTCDCKRLIIKSSSDAAHTICNRYKYVQSPHHFVSAVFSWCDVRVFVIVSLQFCFFVAQPCTWWYRTEDRLIKRVCL